MKIDWLNDECTRARVTRGWFRRRSTIIVMSRNPDSRVVEWTHETSGAPMLTPPPNRSNGWSWKDERDREIRRRKDAVAAELEASNWATPAKLPKAKVRR